MRRPSKRLAVLGVVGLVTAVVTAPAVAAPVVYEAENATIINGVVERTRAGYTGSGYVNSNNVVGAAIEFTVNNSSAGSRTLAFRYANGVSVNRPATLTINGATHSTPSFPGTGAWTTW